MIFFRKKVNICMSVLATIHDISQELERRILDEVVVKKQIKYYDVRTGKKKIKEEAVQPYRVDPATRTLFLPFHWGLTHVPGLKRRERAAYHPIDYTFQLQLRPVQIEVKDQCIQALNKHGCHLLSLYAGAGKTLLTIYLATKLKLKTLVVCHRLILIEQWKQAIEKALSTPTCTPSVAVVKPAKLSTEADFLLINCENIAKVGYEAFQDVGFVVCDEVHALLAEKLSRALQYLAPRYLVMLSATPERPDGMERLLDFYLGPNNMTVRELYHPHIVYKIALKYAYSHSSSEWSALMTEQCCSEPRNIEMFRLVLHFIRESAAQGDIRNVLVLCQRIDQVQFLAHLFREHGFLTSSLAGSDNDYDPEAQVIIGVFSKIGMGFSCPHLNTLVMASDVISDDTIVYLQQYLARIMRTPETKAVVIDFVDSVPVMKKHFLLRKARYLQYGGQLRTFTADFPTFDASKSEI